MRTAPPSLLGVTRAARSSARLGEVADVGRGHLVLAHLDPCRRVRRSDRRLGWNDDGRRLGHGAVRAARSRLGSDGLRLLGRGAVRFGEQVDDRRPRRFLQHRRDNPQGEQHKQQQQIDAERKREAGRSAAERRTVVWGREPVGGQEVAGLGSCVACDAALAHSNLNRE